MTLDEIRREWEEGLQVVAVKEEDYQTGRTERCLVILRRLVKGQITYQNYFEYFCHRYFLMGEDWSVSVDASRVDAETAMKWAFDPKALGN